MTADTFEHDYDLGELQTITPAKRDFSMLVTPRYVERYVDDVYEGYTADLLTNLSRDTALFLDIGAHYGFYTLLVGTAHTDCTIISFEPVPENYEVLRRNVEGSNLAQVELHNLAVSDKTEARELNVAEASDCCGFYELPLARSVKKIPVPAVALDDFLGSTPKGAITLKVDVEGHELAVLEGMKRTLEEADDIRLFMEFCPECLRQAGHEPEDMLRTLDQLGFDIYFIDDKQRRTYRLAGDDPSDWHAYVRDGYANLLCRRKKRSLSACFFSHSSWLAGAERSLLELVTELIRDHGVVCTVVLPGVGPLGQKLEEAGAATLAVDYAWWCESSGRQDPKLEPGLTSSLEALLEEIPEIERINPDVIVTNTMVIPWGAIVAFLLGKPHVWSIDEFGQLDYGFSFHLPFQTILRFIRDSSNLLFVHSDALRNVLFGSAPDSDVFVLPYHICIPPDALREDASDYFTREDATRLIITGTGVESKGQEDAVLAVKELVRRGKDVELVVLGPISAWYLEELRRIVRQENLERHVRFLGFRDNVYPIVSQADIVLVCSRYEAFGRVTLEAMLLKKPVIGTNVAGTPELIKDGFNGLLYQPGDYKQLADCIAYLIEHREKIQEFGENGHQFAHAEFTKEKSGGRAYELLKGLQGAPNPFPSPFLHFIARLLGNSISAFSGENSKLEQRLADEKQEAETLRVVVAEREDTIQTLSAQLGQREQTVEVVSAERETLRPVVPEREEAIQTLSAQLEEKKQTAQALRSELDVIYSSKTWRIAKRGLRVYQVAEAACGRVARLTTGWRRR